VPRNTAVSPRRRASPSPACTSRVPGPRPAKPAPHERGIGSAGDLHLKCEGRLTLEALRGATLRSARDVDVQDLNVRCQAQIVFAGHGATTAEVTSAGMTTVKGSVGLGQLTGAALGALDSAQPGRPSRTVTWATAGFVAAAMVASAWLV
jgi:hypothetical protein